MTTDNAHSQGEKYALAALAFARGFYVLTVPELCTVPERWGIRL
jgi:hypothetical protein